MWKSKLYLHRLQLWFQLYLFDLYLKNNFRNEIGRSIGAAYLLESNE